VKNLRKLLPDLPDFLCFAGLCLLGYGLFLFLPWVSFAVCGCLLLAAGVYLSIPARPRGEG
jgi:hypothetical protein